VRAGEPVVWKRWTNLVYQVQFYKPVYKDNVLETEGYTNVKFFSDAFPTRTTDITNQFFEDWNEDSPYIIGKDRSGNEFLGNIVEIKLQNYLTMEERVIVRENRRRM
jgi:hypothetical protein